MSFSQFYFCESYFIGVHLYAHQKKPIYQKSFAYLIECLKRPSEVDIIIPSRHIQAKSDYKIVVTKTRGEFEREGIWLQLGKGVKSVSYVVQNIRIKHLDASKSFKRDLLVLAL